jgi:thiol-disulfide isomerase/thioredoxin
VKAPVDTIVAPLFPTTLPWVNTTGRKESVLQRGRPMLVEFWDFCRPNSIRTLPYVKAWHERYREDGLRVIGVHCPGFDCSRSEQAVRDAVERLQIEHPVLVDSEFDLWREYDNKGWPARYLFDGRARLFDYHYGEGGYRDTELAIQELLGIEREPLPAMRPEDAPDARLRIQTPDQQGAYSGEYEAGGVWAVLAPIAGQADTGYIEVNGSGIQVEHAGAYSLVEHERHTAATLELQIDPSVECLGTCFTPGLA